MSLQIQIAAAHLLSRKRQTIASLMGVILGVAFFLAVSSLMQGSELDFIRRLVDNAPHVTVYDEFRKAPTQPLEDQFPEAALALHNLKPRNEVRGIRGYKEILTFIEQMPGVRVAPVLTGSVILSSNGKSEGGSLSGAIPALMKQVSTIDDYMTEGTLESLDANPNGLIIGGGLAKKLNVEIGDSVRIAASDGSNRTMKLVGFFRTGNANYDDTQAFMLLKRAQSLLNRPNRANRLILQLDDAYAARDVAAVIEAKIGYKSQSWQEASEDILNVLLVRNTIMYSVVSAILIVASFGIYNVISTVVMEKTRDIAILKSMGFTGKDIRRIFVIEGTLLGVIGSTLGIFFGIGLMRVLEQITIKPPGSNNLVQLPIYWGVEQFLMAIAFAMMASVGAAYLPARKGGRVHPVDILRGAG